MKLRLLVGIAVAALIVSPALCADLRVKPAYRPLAAAPVFSWTGCYVGANIGGGWGSKTISAPDLAPGISVTGHTSGVLGGGQLGCDYQFAPNWVIGIEGSGSAADINGDVTASVLGISGTGHSRTDWISSVTGRFGWAWDRVLLYAKGGAAWAGDKYSADIPIFPEHLEARETRAGWTFGAGLEWAFWRNWSAKVEYGYYDFGTRDLTFTGTFAGFPIVVPDIDIRQRISVALFGINYRFGSGLALFRY